MRRTIFLPLLSVALLCGQILPIARAAQTNEAPFIQILQSTSSTPREKAAACAQLKLIGTEQSVDALAALLTNEELSHSARYVLESMPSAKAGKALRRALQKTTGPLQVGIINSLGIRHESAAVQDLGKLLSSRDQNVAVASAEALGRIGGSSALKRLQASVAKSSGALHQAGTDAILMCATHLLDAGDSAAALKIFEGLYKREKAETVRQAAFGGMILASGERGVALVTDAILNGDAASRATALHFASQLKGAETTKTLADLAVGAKAPVQIALIECLVQRGDPAAGPAIMELTGSGDAAVSLEAIISLGSLGNESSVGLTADP
jgi:HEAT repeat protein